MAFIIIFRHGSESTNLVKKTYLVYVFVRLGFRLLYKPMDYLQRKDDCAMNVIP